jgi:hypothetical protein
MREQRGNIKSFYFQNEMIYKIILMFFVQQKKVL